MKLTSADTLTQREAHNNKYPFNNRDPSCSYLIIKIHPQRKENISATSL